MKELDHPKITRKKNLSNKEFQAMMDLHNNPNITIKPTDKGGSIVIMNIVDYGKEAQRQLSNPQHYKTLDKNPTTPYSRYIHPLIDQAWRLKPQRITYKLRIQKFLHFTFHPKYISLTIQAGL